MPPMGLISLIIFVSVAWVGPARAHDGHGARAPVLACAQQRLGDLCGYVDAAHVRQEGTCRALPGGLVCVRNRPLRTPPDAHLVPLIVRATALGFSILW